MMHPLHRGRYHHQSINRSTVVNRLVLLAVVPFVILLTLTSLTPSRQTPTSTSTFNPTSWSVMALSSPGPIATTKVAVIGSTGRLGRETVSELVQAGVNVKCLVRPTTHIPPEWTDGIESKQIEVVRGEIITSQGGQETLTTLLDGCTYCLALYGATRKSKLSDIWQPNVEDTDMTHSKQVNYESIKTLVEVCRQPTCTCKNIIRITGKGEDPTSFFSVLINMLGSIAKGWNYEGECTLRSTPVDEIGYTIIRPGIMKAVVDLDGDGTDKKPPQHLELRDNGGNDLKVSAVSYNQIAQLVVGCCTTPPDGGVGPRRRVTFSAMNVPGKATQTIQDQILALKNDSRSYPLSLIKEHKAAVSRVVKILGAVMTGFVAVIVGTILKMISSSS
mmetsp:Transcript_2754/g.5973  ORF Transcript_2754/g.5973 Transcript_2754/m.5973 type:complete len:389 (-) Transcript_2754:4931-6097(-)